MTEAEGVLWIYPPYLVRLLQFLKNGYAVMPRKLEERLKREAKEKFPGDKEKQDAYVYGTLRVSKKRRKRKKK